MKKFTSLSLNLGTSLLDPREIGVRIGNISCLKYRFNLSVSLNRSSPYRTIELLIRSGIPLFTYVLIFSRCSVIRLNTLR